MTMDHSTPVKHSKNLPNNGNLITSHHHQSSQNQMVLLKDKRQIQTIKRVLIKAKQAGRDPNLTMLCLQTTPINHNLLSPAELLNNRILRSNLIAKVSTPRFSNTDHIHEEVKHRQDMQKMYHDRTAHDLPPLIPGQDVRILDNQSGEGKPATITSRCAKPRSYIL